MKTFNSTEFASVENKADVRTKIINALGLEHWEVEGFYFNPLEAPNVPDKINYFVESFPIESKRLLNLSVSGLGPGEILLYFLCDNLTLSGYKSQIDASVDGSEFAEVKAVLPSNKPNWYYDFRFGVQASEPNHQLLLDVRNFVNHTNNPALLANELEVTRTKISELRKIELDVDEYSLPLKVIDGFIYVGQDRLCKRSDVDFARRIQEAFDTKSYKTPNHFSAIEDRYFNAVLASPIGNHDFIFFDRNSAKCIYFGKLERDMLAIERITQGKIKPFVKLVDESRFYK